MKVYWNALKQIPALQALEPNVRGKIWSYCSYCCYRDPRCWLVAVGLVILYALSWAILPTLTRLYGHNVTAVALLVFQIIFSILVGLAIMLKDAYAARFLPEAIEKFASKPHLD